MVLFKVLLFMACCERKYVKVLFCEFYGPGYCSSSSTSCLGISQEIYYFSRNMNSNK